jgi:hypothetical protein
MALVMKMMATPSDHRKPTITFSKLVDELQQHYGPPAPLPSTDPLELIIWEGISYLASDERRAGAFASNEASEHVPSRGMKANRDCATTIPSF